MFRKTEKAYTRLLALTILLAASLAYGGESRPVNITIAATNDLHGYLEPSKPDITGKKPVGGAEYISWYVNSLRDMNPGGFLLVDAGDFMSGTFISNFNKGKAVIELFNMLGYNAATIGNHEFDFGMALPGGDPQGVLKQRASEAAFPLLSANIYDKATGQRWSAANIKPYIIVERRGFKIGIMGLTSANTPLTTHPDFIRNLDFRSTVAEAARLIPEMKAKGADTIIVLAHLVGGCSTTCNGEIAELAGALNPADVSLLVTGHSHILISQRVHGIPVMQTYSKGIALGHAELYFDPDTRKVITERTTIFKPLFMYDELQGNKDTENSSLFASNPGVKPDPKSRELVASYKALISKIKDQYVCNAAETLERNLYGESSLGVLVTDAMRKHLPDVQVAMYNSGGIRADIPAGKVTYGRIFDALPFESLLIRMKLTGAQIREIIEKGAGRTFGLMAISGVSTTLDQSARPGEKVVSLSIDGKPVEPDKLYTVVTNDFLLAGGDGFTPFTKGVDVFNTHTLIRNIFEEYLRKMGTVQPPAQRWYKMQNPVFKSGDSTN
ncbi:MAG: bifunctional UDP-sugar hydrolase/5'-nucleotidase [Myxococcota bacterium]|jgi:2',3'-cyclic-nucleotide 2'-phosphodiesterase (5'-nucleotidase family)